MIRKISAIINVGLLLLLGSASLRPSQAHIRFQCPAPRSTLSSIKQGPCGIETGDFSGPQIVMAPGPQTLVIEETVRHIGSPMRIALSLDASDSYEDCILLNHIPHNDAVNTQDNSRFYSITVNIPDVDCENCALQAIQVMTDKIRANLGAGVSNCIYDASATLSWANGNCGSNYHSCANVRITGSIPRDQFTCPPQPQDWPHRDLETLVFSDNESGPWSNGVYNGAPAFYQSPAGICAAPAANPISPTEPSSPPVPPANGEAESAPAEPTTAVPGGDATAGGAATATGAAGALLPSTSVLSGSFLFVLALAYAHQ